jgi:hypothetical protein
VSKPKIGDIWSKVYGGSRYHYLLLELSYPNLQYFRMLNIENGEIYINKIYADLWRFEA